MELMDPLAAGFRLNGDNGEAVVLSHGFTGTAAHMRPLAGELHAAGFTVVAPLLAGHGTTIEDLGTTGADDWIGSVRDAVHGVADHHRVHLAGLSMGGLISLVLATEVRAATVTTINSPVISRDKTLYLAELVHRFRPMVTWPEQPPPDLDEEVEPFWLTYDGFPTKAAGQLVSILRRAVFAARRVRVPSLVVQSRIDESVDPRSAKVLSWLLGSTCRVVWLERSMHNATVDRERDVIAREVLALLRQGA